MVNNEFSRRTFVKASASIPLMGLLADSSIAQEDDDTSKEGGVLKLRRAGHSRDLLLHYYPIIFADDLYRIPPKSSFNHLPADARAEIFTRIDGFLESEKNLLKKNALEGLEGTNRKELSSIIDNVYSRTSSKARKEAQQEEESRDDERDGEIQECMNKKAESKNKERRENAVEKGEDPKKINEADPEDYRWACYAEVYSKRVWERFVHALEDEVVRNGSKLFYEQVEKPIAKSLTGERDRFKAYAHERREVWAKAVSDWVEDKRRKVEDTIEKYTPRW